MKYLIQGVAFALAAAALIWGGMNYTQRWESDTDRDSGQNGTLPPGLEIETVQEGQGRAAAAGDLVIIHYEGAFPDGKKFDSSYDRGVPYRVILGRNQVIPGFEMALLGMKPGEKRLVTIPPELGYGSEDYGDIPGGSTLRFILELVEFGEIPQD